MQQIVLQKTVQTKYPIDGITLVNLEDEIEYKNTKDGVYATGVIKINGEYYKGVRNNKFNDQIDVDIFAPLEDLGDRFELKVKIIDFDYKINEDLLFFDIILELDGLKDVKKTFLTSDKMEEEEIIEDKVVEEERSNNPFLSDDIETVKKEDEENDLANGNINNSNLNINKDKKFPIQFQKSKLKNSVCWSYHVVLKDDTYESISKELNIKEETLRSKNENKELYEGLMLILP